MILKSKNLISAILMAIVTVAMMRLASAANQNPCEGFEKRKAHLELIAIDQKVSLSKMRPGTTATYEVTEILAGHAQNHREEKTLISLDSVKGRMKIKTRIISNGTEVSSKVAEEPVRLMIPPPRTPSACNDIYLFAHRYGGEDITISGKQIRTHWRAQLNVGSADFKEFYASDVPFSKVKEVLEDKGSEHTLREKKLVSFQF